MHRTESDNRAIDRPVPRQSNIELLRIVAMGFIVAHHYTIYSGFSPGPEAGPVNRLWILFYQMGGRLGVNVFVLISGYFLSAAPAFRARRAVRLWAQVLCYSVLSFAVFTLTGARPFGAKALIKHLFPITFSQWWFASAYFVLYLLSPFVNRLLNALDRRRHALLLGLMGMIWCVIPTFTGQTLPGGTLAWFVFLYALAAYLRRCGLPGKPSGGIWLLLSALLIALTFGAAWLLEALGPRIPYFGGNPTFLYEMHRLPALLIALTLFIGFAKLDLGRSRIVNALSATMFGVYLIHDDVYVRPFLWRTLLHSADLNASPLLIPWSLAAVLAVMLACAAIEWVRQRTLERLFRPLTDGLSARIDAWLQKK